jgi:hypothetical protein
MEPPDICNTVWGYISLGDTGKPQKVEVCVWTYT